MDVGWVYLDVCRMYYYHLPDCALADGISAEATV